MSLLLLLPLPPPTLSHNQICSAHDFTNETNVMKNTYLLCRDLASVVGQDSKDPLLLKIIECTTTTGFLGLGLERNNLSKRQKASVSNRCIYIYTIYDVGRKRKKERLSYWVPKKQ